MATIDGRSQKKKMIILNVNNLFTGYLTTGITKDFLETILFSCRQLNYMKI